ncbi:hypothetical protein SAMN05192575_10353 [Nocardioides alpinus]|uniref:Uncharacterized protein n=1 Tax=Nocardioides alpinus TaxID=748909 RepID=A0A1I0XYB3_9ACTN|nr:hypothetical protein SAMN05192575_10353 [Nocardioides alpinus]
MVAAVVADEAVKPRSPLSMRVGITAPMTTRSKPSSATASQHRTTGQWGDRDVEVEGADVVPRDMRALLTERGRAEMPSRPTVTVVTTRTDETFPSSGSLGGLGRAPAS